jgi:cytochrome c5
VIPRAVSTVLAFGFAGLLLGVTACSPNPRATQEARLAFVDSVLTELGGGPAADMSRGQRWRMISSIGAGLPPSGLQITDLPNPGSRGAIVLQTYCARCHQLPAPQMHAAAEWPVLVRRMVLRATTLRDRMGGPVMHEMLGDVLMSGMASAEVPAREEVDSLVAYLQAHAMPTADLEELGTGPEAQLFKERCSLCHEVPDPAAHTPAEWGEVVARMRMNAGLLGTPSITGDEAERIVAYLSEVSAG